MSPSRGSANANQCCKRDRISRPTPARLEVCRWSALFLAHFLPTWLVIFFLATAFSSHAPVEDRPIQRFGLHQAHHYYRVMRETNTPWGLPQGIPHQPWFQRRRTRFWSAKHQIPYNVIMILPGKESNNDKFGLTIDKAMPVIDIAIEDIVHSQIMPEGWINITYHDSRVWEDTLLAERYATVGVVQAYCEHRLDAIFGFADSYSLATVSKVSAGFGHGVPIITTTGLNSQIGSKRSYPYVTRMTGSYWQMAQSTYQFIAHHQEEEQNSGVNSTNLNYKNLVFMYHDKKRAINRHQVMGENADDTVSSHCYFSLHSIKNYFREKSEHFKESWKVQTPYWPFDEEENRKENDTKEWVKMASNAANGDLHMPPSVYPQLPLLISRIRPTKSPIPPFWTILCLLLLNPTLIHASMLQSQLRFNRPPASARLPLHIVVGLPSEEGSLIRNPYKLTISKSQPVFDVAVEDIIYKRQLLPHGALRIAYEDTQLSDAVGPQKIVDHYCNQSVDAVMGLAYVYALAPVARMSQYWESGVPVFTTTALVDELGDKQIFPLLTRLMGTYRTLAAMVQKMMKELKWRQFHFFFNDAAAHGGSQGRSECYFSLNAIKNIFNNERDIIWTVEMFSEQSARTEYKNRMTSFFNVLLKKASMLTNVIILCASPDTVREIMLSAHELGMATSGEYVFINIDVSTGSHAEKPWLRSNDTTNSSDSTAVRKINDENNKAKEAYRALKTISLRRSDLDEYKNFEQRVKERAEKKYHYSKKTGKEYEMNNFISAFYDAVLLYAIALNETLSEGLDPRNGRNITSKMWNRTFVGITGNVSIDHNGDRYSDYSLLDLDPTQDKFVEVAYYSGASNQLKQITDFHWVRGQPPKDSPICGWDHSKCPEGYPAHVYALFAAAMIICLCACGLVFFIRRYMLEKELAAMQWKIRWEELVNDEQREKNKAKKKTRPRKPAENAVFGNNEQSEALLRSNSRISMNSDKFLEDDPDMFLGGGSTTPGRMRLRSSSSGATRKISAMIDRKFSIFTRKKSSPTTEKQHLDNNHTAAYDERNISSPSYSISNSNKKKSSGEDDYELNTKKSLSLKNRKFSFSGYSIKSGGSVETINMPGANHQVFTKTGYYKGVTVAMKMLNIDPKKYPKLELSRSLLMEFKRMKDLQHDHITRFFGACVDCPHYCIVTEYCPKGSLEDILENEKFKLDKMMKYSLLHDLVKGMYFLHNSEIRSHGKLKSSNCVVDSRFVLKVTDFGLAELHAMEETTIDEGETHAFYRKQLWTAPELLRDPNAPPQGTQKADVYSFAIIFHEMLYRKGAFYRGDDETPGPDEILKNVRAFPKNENDLYRPIIPSDAPPVEDEHPETTKRLMELMVSSWSENPHDRPEFSLIRKVVHSLNKDNETSNLVDNLLKRMEQYANNLELMVEERTQEYLGEKKKVEELLHQLLPPAIADQLIAGNAVQAESYECVTIYFSDIVGFTALSSLSTPMQVVTLLNDLYLAFDGVVDNFKVYKVETIGDAYMVVSGLPEPHKEHASQIAQMSLALLIKVKNFTIRHRPNEQLKLRIGIHSGSVVAGVVGSKMPRYCLFGDTVNTSSRMESNGLPLRIHVSSDTKEILAEDPDFRLDLRGEVEMKGKGKQTTYWLKGYKDVNLPDFGPEYR